MEQLKRRTYKHRRFMYLHLYVFAYFANPVHSWSVYYRDKFVVHHNAPMHILIRSQNAYVQRCRSCKCNLATSTSKLNWYFKTKTMCYFYKSGVHSQTITWVEVAIRRYWYCTKGFAYKYNFYRTSPNFCVRIKKALHFSNFDLLLHGISINYRFSS